MKIRKNTIIITIVICLVIIACAAFAFIHYHDMFRLDDNDKIIDEISISCGIPEESIKLVQLQDYKALDSDNYYGVLFTADEHLGSMIFKKDKLIKSYGVAAFGQYENDKALSSYVNFEYDPDKDSTQGLIVCYGDSTVDNANMCEIYAKNNLSQELIVSTIDEGELPQGKFLYMDYVVVDGRVTIANYSYYGENHKLIISEACAGSY